MTRFWAGCSHPCDSTPAVFVKRYCMGDRVAKLGRPTFTFFLSVRSVLQFEFSSLSTVWQFGLVILTVGFVPFPFYLSSLKTGFEFGLFGSILASRPGPSEWCPATVPTTQTPPATSRRSASRYCSPHSTAVKQRFFYVPLRCIDSGGSRSSC